ncbi:hypothetical protein ACHQM5_003259 [Ranunculus cassubicifolius]
MKNTNLSTFSTYLVGRVIHCLSLAYIDLLLRSIDAPGGFLFEWWSVFWDIFIARTNEKHSEVAAAYIEVWLLFF